MFFLLTEIESDLTEGMKATELRRMEKELEAYLSEMLEGLGRRERVEALGHYVEGLLLDGKRKSIEPIASRLVVLPEQIVRAKNKKSLMRMH